MNYLCFLYPSVSELGIPAVLNSAAHSSTHCCWWGGHRIFFISAEKELGRIVPQLEMIVRCDCSPGSGYSGSLSFNFPSPFCLHMGSWMTKQCNFNLQISRQIQFTWHWFWGFECGILFVWFGELLCFWDVKYLLFAQCFTEDGIEGFLWGGCRDQLLGRFPQVTIPLLSPASTSHHLWNLWCFIPNSLFQRWMFVGKWGIVCSALPSALLTTCSWLLDLLRNPPQQGTCGLMLRAEWSGVAREFKFKMKANKICISYSFWNSFLK